MPNESSKGGTDRSNDVGDSEYVKSVIAGTLAGLSASFTVAPLDVLRTNLQNRAKEISQNRFKVASEFKRIWFEDGIRGFYRGFKFTMYAYSADRAIWFSIHDITYCYAQYLFGPEKIERSKFFWEVCSSTVGSVFSIIATNPIWVLRTRLMVIRRSVSDSAFLPYRNLLSALSHLVKAGGIKSLYAGTVPSLLGIPHVAIQYPLYVKLRDIFREYERDDYISIVASTFLSKIVASLFTYPHEVIRTRLHMLGLNINNDDLNYYKRVSKLSLIDKCKIMVKEEGYRVMYRGLGISLIRSLPSSFVTLWTYENVKNMDLSIIGFKHK